MDPDDILAKQVEQLEKEKRELQEKLKAQEKKVTREHCTFYTILYVHQGRYVMPGVCLSVCVLPTLRKTTERVFTKILPQMYLCTRKNWFSFGSHPLPYPDPGIFWKIVQHCEIGHFSTFGLMSSDSDRIMMKILSQMYPWTKKSLLNFGSNPEPESVSGYRLRIQIIFSLVDVCGLWLLFIDSCFITFHKVSLIEWRLCDCTSCKSC